MTIGNGDRRGFGIALAAAIAVTALAAVHGSGLRISPRLLDLVPDGRPAADAYRELLEAGGGVERVWIAVLPGEGDPPDPAVLTEASAALAERAAAIDGIGFARSGIEEADERFLLDEVLPRAVLGPGLSDAERAGRLSPDAIGERVDRMAASMRSPAGAAAAPLLAADPLGFAGESLEAPAAVPVDQATGAFLASDGGAALVVLTPTADELDTAFGRRLAVELRRAFDDVSREVGRPLRFEAAGGPLYAAQDEAILRGDIVRTVTGSALAVSLLLVLFFRGVGIPAALLLSVAAGVAWTAAITRGLHDTITVVGVSFASILLGLGVDYGIHWAARYRAARLDGLAPRHAALSAVRVAGPGVAASAATTAAGFLALLAAHLQSAREMGTVVAGGIIAILLATVAVGIPAVVVCDRGSPSGDGGRLWVLAGRLCDSLSHLGTRRPVPVLLTAGVVAVAGLAGTARLTFDADPRAMRPDDHPASRAEETLGEAFSLGLDSAWAIVSGADVDEALDRASRVAREVGRVEPGTVVRSPSDWLLTPAEAEARARPVAGEPARRAAAALRGELAKHGFREDAFAKPLAVLDGLAEGRIPERPPAGTWPDWLSGRILAGAGRARVLVELRAPTGAWNSGPPSRVLDAIEAAAPGTRVASFPRVAAELRGLLAEDLERISLIALVAVSGIVLIAVRFSPISAIAAMLPVTLGAIGALGACGLAGVPLDAISAAMAPVLVGIGIDDGLHAVVGVGREGYRNSIRAAGRAMVLTTLTTVAGFAGLGLSHVPALRRGGWIVASGALLCLLATLAVIPAVDSLRGRDAR